jgi:hypothetical protein
MPTPKQMEKLAAEGARRAPMKSRRLMASPKGTREAPIANYYVAAILKLKWGLLENCVPSWDYDFRVRSFAPV